LLLPGGGGGGGGDDMTVDVGDELCMGGSWEVSRSQAK